MDSPLPISERSNLSLDDLRVFVAIADAGTLAAAARHLELPKSTLSRRLARLEQVLAVSLFARSRQRLALTEVGRRLLDLARAALVDARAIVQAAAESRAEPEGRLRVTAPLDLANADALWVGFIERHRGVALALDLSNRYLDLLPGHDLALRAGRGDDPTLLARRIGSYRLRAVASPSYLAQHGRPRAAADLRRHSCILMANFQPKRGAPREPPAPHRRHIVPDPRLALQAAKAGLGIAILHDALVADDLDAGTLVSALDAYDPLTVPLYAVYPEARFLSPAAQAFIAHASEVFG